MCADLLVDTWAAESWPCEPYFEISMVIFKTEKYYSWLEHFAQTFEQMYLERKTNTFGWPQEKDEKDFLFSLGRTGDEYYH